MDRNVSDHIYTLHRSPFSLAPIIHGFYQSWEPIEKDILLSYLILPIITFKPMHGFLKGARQKSSIRTMTSNSGRLIGLQLRIEEFKPITHAALLILAAEKQIEINPDLSVQTFNKPRAANCDKTLLRYGQKLAMVFSGEDVVSTYRTLGIKSL